MTPAPFLWPAAFVLLWATGFIGARYGLPYADPLTLLATRFVVASALLAGIAAALPRGRRAVRMPSGREFLWLSVAGIMMHGVYLGAVFIAISMGLEAGPAAIISALSPIISAIGGWIWLQEKLGPQRLLGVALGFVGVALVVWEKLEAGLGSPLAAAICLAAPVGFAAGALVQKIKLDDAPLISGNAVQYLAAAALTGPAALMFEDMRMVWTPTFSLAFAWLVIALSIGAILLLYMLLRRGEAASVSSLIYLVPGVTALYGWILFGERLGELALAGLALTALGVALVNNAIPWKRRHSFSDHS